MLTDELCNRNITVYLPGAGKTGYSARIVGVRGRLIAVTPPTNGRKVLWVAPGTRIALSLDGATTNRDALIVGQVVARKLKPVPLLVVDALDEIPEPAAAPARRCRTVAVTSGKGGTGKTFVSTNLAVILAGLGYRVALVDGDLGTGNVCVHLGLEAERDLGDVLQGKGEVAEITLAGPGGVTVIPGAAASPELAAPSPWQLGRLVATVSHLEGTHDFVLVDTGAGLSTAVETLLLAAGEILVISTEDRASALDAYGLIKLSTRQESPQLIHLILNRVVSDRRARNRAENLVSTAHKFLDVRVNLLGYVEHDPGVLLALEHQQPCVSLFPSAPASGALRAAAEKLTRPSDNGTA